jgi:hypothetical protein
LEDKEVVIEQATPSKINKQEVIKPKSKAAKPTAVPSEIPQAIAASSNLASPPQQLVQAKNINIDDGWESILSYEDFCKKSRSTANMGEKTAINYYLNLCTDRNFFSVAKKIVTLYSETLFFKCFIDTVADNLKSSYYERYFIKEIPSRSGGNANQTTPNINEFIKSLEMFPAGHQELWRELKLSKNIKLLTSLDVFVNKGGHIYSDSLLRKLKGYLIARMKNRLPTDWFHVFHGIRSSEEVTEMDETDYFDTYFRLLESDVLTWQKKMKQSRQEKTEEAQNPPNSVDKRSNYEGAGNGHESNLDHDKDRKAALAKMMGFDESESEESQISELEISESAVVFKENDENVMYKQFETKVHSDIIDSLFSSDEEFFSGEPTMDNSRKRVRFDASDQGPENLFPESGEIELYEGHELKNDNDSDDDENEMKVDIGNDISQLSEYTVAEKIDIPENFLLPTDFQDFFLFYCLSRSCISLVSQIPFIFRLFLFDFFLFIFPQNKSNLIEEVILESLVNSNICMNFGLFYSILLNFIEPTLNSSNQNPGREETLIKIGFILRFWKTTILETQALLNEKKLKHENSLKSKLKDLLLHRSKVMLSAVDSVETRIVSTAVTNFSSSFPSLASGYEVSLKDLLMFVEQKFNQPYSHSYLEATVHSYSLQSICNQGLTRLLSSQSLSPERLADFVLSYFQFSPIQIVFQQFSDHFSFYSALQRYKSSASVSTQSPLVMKSSKSFIELLSLPLTNIVSLFSSFSASSSSSTPTFLTGLNSQLELFGKENYFTEILYCVRFEKFWFTKLASISTSTGAVYQNLFFYLLLLKNHFLIPAFSFYYENDNSWNNRSNNGWKTGNVGEGVSLSSIYRDSLKKNVYSCLITLVKLYFPFLIQHCPSENDIPFNKHDCNYFTFDFMTYSNLSSQDLHDISFLLDFIQKHIFSEYLKIRPLPTGNKESQVPTHHYNNSRFEEPQFHVLFNRLHTFVIKLYNLLVLCYWERFFAMSVCSLIALLNVLKNRFQQEKDLRKKEKIIRCILEAIRWVWILFVFFV